MAEKQKPESTAVAKIEQPQAYLTPQGQNQTSEIDEFQKKTMVACKRINESYSVVQRGAQVLVMRQSLDVNNEPVISYMSTKDFDTMLAHDRIWHPSEEKWIPVSKAWISWKGRNEYDGIYFRPNAAPNPRYYNLWNGFRYAEPKADTGKFDIFLDHVKTNICRNDEKSYEWVMSWLADIFQRPERKPGTALVLRGEMGIGKGVFANHVGYLLGKHYFTITNSSQLTGRFNSHLAERVLIFVDESFWSGEKMGAGTLRTLVTESHIASEMKGKDVVMIESYLRLIIAANEEWVVPVGMKDERRFTVLDAGNNCQRNYQYFSEMEKQLLNGGYEALQHYLMNYKHDANLPRTIISTNALLEQKLHSMSPVYQWLFDCLDNGAIAIGEETWPDGKIKTHDFYKSYLDWAQKTRQKEILSDAALGRAMRGWLKMERKQVWHQGWHYFIAKLKDCREQFEDKVGHSIQWGIDEQE